MGIILFFFFFRNGSILEDDDEEMEDEIFGNPAKVTGFDMFSLFL